MTKEIRDSIIDKLENQSSELFDYLQQYSFEESIVMLASNLKAKLSSIERIEGKVFTGLTETEEDREEK